MWKSTQSKVSQLKNQSKLLQIDVKRAIDTLWRNSINIVFKKPKTASLPAIKWQQNIDIL